MSYRSEQVAELIKQKSAMFFNSIADKTSMITVTRCEVSSDSKYATIYISVFPDEYTEKALAFTHRNQRGLHEYLKQKTVLGRIPQTRIVIDEGEKNRQRIDELSRDI